MTDDDNDDVDDDDGDVGDDEPCRADVAVKICFCFLGRAAGVDLRNLGPLSGCRHYVSTAAPPPRRFCRGVSTQKFHGGGGGGGEMRSWRHESESLIQDSHTLTSSKTWTQISKSRNLDTLGGNIVPCVTLIVVRLSKTSLRPPSVSRAPPSLELGAQTAG